MVPVRLLLALLLPALALLAASRPLLATAPKAKMSCCAAMAGQTAKQHPCGDKRVPSNPTDEACCSLCMLGLAMLGTAPLAIAAPAAERETYCAFAFNDFSRAESPPVPPPRV